METTAKHTLGPLYEANMGNDCQGLIVEEKTGANIAVVYEKANAAFIVRACNSHEELLAACKALLHWADDFSHCDVPWPGHLNEAVSAARAALRKAEEADR